MADLHSLRLCPGHKSQALCCILRGEATGHRRGARRAHSLSWSTVLHRCAGHTRPL